MPTDTESVFDQREMQEIAEAVLNGSATDAPVIKIELKGDEYLGEYHMDTLKDKSLPEAIILKCILLETLRMIGVHFTESGSCRYVAIVKQDDGTWRIFDEEGVTWYSTTGCEPTLESLIRRGILQTQN